MSIEIVSASAGTGKTHYVSHAIGDALTPDAASPARVEGLIAVTYTRKAAAELASRIRQVLVTAGAYDRAQRLPLAYVGTVHSVCKRLLDEHAFEAGISPKLEVLPEEEAKSMLEQALEEALDPSFHDRLDALSRALRPNWDAFKRQADWMDDVRKVLDLARSNRIAAEQLAEMGRRSVAGVHALLPAPALDGEALDRALVAQIEALTEHLQRSGDATDVTEKALNALRAALRDRDASGRLPWATWAKLSKVEPSKKHREQTARLHTVAADHERHPRLHADLTAYVTLVFEAAACALASYARWKEERRYIDYVDMEERTLDLLAMPEVAAHLGARLDLFVVDELQDTSPIQLALFLALSRIAARSVWVGDRKQSIFAFRGADPSLMDGVSALVERGGHEPRILETSYRSRPAIVDLVSHAFAPAFERQGIPARQVHATAHRTDDARLSTLPPFGVFSLATKNAGEDVSAIAEGVRRLLEAPGETPVVDRQTGETRDLRAGDIAILTRTNTDAAALAAALEQRGVRASLPRAGLLATPEGSIVSAALRLLVDASDRLATAEIEALTGFGGRDPDGWLDAILARRAAEIARRSATPGVPGPAPPVEPQHDALVRIAALRAGSSMLSPSEAVDALIAALGLVELCARWPQPTQRIGNIDALRRLAHAYEERCAQRREAGTLAGLVHYFGAIEGESDHQHVSAGDEAVELSTYHRAKGLEWPVVVLSSLSFERESRAFGVAVESERAGIDLEDPLAGRWIRLWPWPYGDQKKLPLADAAAASPEAGRAADLAARESLRLLYVGFTRARDHLVFAVRDDKNGRRWLDAIDDDSGPRVELPRRAEDAAIVAVRGTGCSHAARVLRLDPGASPPVALPRIERHAAFTSPGPRGAADSPPPYAIAPSRAASEWSGLPAARVVGTLVLAGRVAWRLGESDVAIVGTAIHGFLAADCFEAGLEARVARAREQLEARDLRATVRPEHLVAASDALRAALDERWPGAVWHREVPIRARVATDHGARQVMGSIDLLLETDAGFVVIDHKSFLGVSDPSRALVHAPQLAAYGRAIGMASPKPVMAYWLHSPLQGAMVEIAFEG